MIKLDLSKCLNISKEKILDKYTFKLAGIRQSFFNRTSVGSEYLDWIDYPNSNFYNNEYKLMHAINSNWIERGVDTIVVVGIGGSSIGAKAIIDMCSQRYLLRGMEVIFVSGLHTSYNVSLLKSLEKRNWALVYITKSGTTFESRINFRLFREKLYFKYGENHNRRIVVITDVNSFRTKDIAKKNNYYLLTTPSNIPGRFSTITPVGLFPCLLAGLDIDEIIKGWKHEINIFKSDELSKLDSMIYAATRHHLLSSENKSIEVFNTFENNLCAMSEHYKQMFAESEGKLRECLIPTITNNSDDLHSIGQLYQQGPRNFFETTLMFKSIKGEVIVPKSSFNNDDELDILYGQNLLQLNYWVQLSVRSAHYDIPNIVIRMDSSDEQHAGMLIAWLAIAAATSARLLNVNPFDQPGVELYKDRLRRFIK